MFDQAAVFMDDENSRLGRDAGLPGDGEIAEEVAGSAGISDITDFNVGVILGDSDSCGYRRGLGIQFFIAGQGGHGCGHVACDFQDSFDEFTTTEGTIDIEVD
jgi:hypothetical protein